MARKRPVTDPDDAWDRIAQSAIEEAEGVECALEEFARGLGIIEKGIRARKELAENEVQHGTERDDD